MDDRTDVEIRKASAIGSRELKDTQSAEYAYQTVNWLKTCYRSEQLSYQEYLKALAEVDQDRIYERVPVNRPYGSLAALVKAELGVESVEESKERKQLAVQKLAEQTEAIPGWGEIGKGRNRVDVINSKATGGTDPTYLTGRIARDRPDILERMKAGEYPSVRAAALEAGIVQPRLSVPLDPDQLAAALLRQLEPDAVRRVVALLLEGVS
jgi:hypothetical protein